MKQLIVTAKEGEMENRANCPRSSSTDLLARADKAIDRLLEWTELVGDGGCRSHEVNVAERYAKRVQREIRRANEKVRHGGPDVTE